MEQKNTIIGDQHLNINNNNKKYYILTFGCQMNENDSEKIAGMLENMDYSPTSSPESADIIIINTCSVRATADQ